MGTITCEATRETITWLDTAGEDVCRFDYTLAPGPRNRHGAWLPHIHPKQDESFRVVHGTAHFRVSGDGTTLGAGGTVTVPKGTRHRFWNAGDDELRMEIELRPALKSRQVFEVIFDLADRYPTLPGGVPRRPLLMGLFGERFIEEVIIEPRALQVPMSRLLAAIARRLGKELPEPS